MSEGRDDHPLPALAMLGTWGTFLAAAWYFGSHRPEHPDLGGGFVHYFKSFNAVVYLNDGEHHFMIAMKGVVAIVTVGAIAFGFWKKYIVPAP